MTTKTTLKIKALGNAQTGSALLDLMEYYNVTRLLDITEEQAEEYYRIKTEEGEAYVSSKEK